VDSRAAILSLGRQQARKLGLGATHEASAYKGSLGKLMLWRWRAPYNFPRRIGAATSKGAL